ncbi:MAG: DNA methyltransferase [Cytophagales bacterium]|nr:MAG: DNA methyltransferase [Cytophagales bacterium]
MTTQQYIDNINKRYKLGNATEHTFRGDLQQLLESLVPEIRATNEPKRQSCGAPDYILTKKEIPVGFIEAKDIGDKDLEGAKKTGNKEQFDRYKASLNNLIFTDYLDFHLYIDGVFITKIAIAEISPSPLGRAGEGVIVPLPNNFATFTNLIKDFCTHVGQTIKSSKKLAEIMAGKARLLSDVIEKSLTSDETHNEDSTLKDQMIAFRQILIHDITPKGFADVYAQTIAYGMFAARLHDPTLETFSRQEAAELIPKSNPFLRKLFGYIAGPDIDDRIKWIVDSLVDIFLACNVEEILKNYGKQFTSSSGGGREGADPIIHFYETFLSEYDPALRKAKGVWYTPQPVVNFIVRAVDDILKTEFDLPQGLADTSKTKIKVDIQGKKTEQEVHKVQILDPATGTGTFLAEVVKHIHKKFEGQKGIWSNYVENDLLPRINGFELLMASYAMAHLKLDLLLNETGYSPSPMGRAGVGFQRLRVYLTNSLEESHPDTGTLFANWLSTEANEANHIKRETPVMCVIGNPPYAVSSTNKATWIEKLTKDYKKGLNERNIQPLSDDYIKFIRFGQHFVEKNGSGILAYISNNSFLDGIIHRQMRKNLLECFDTIYILDLHGNIKKKEICTDGSPDQNVFDIMQGVSINIFVKTGKKKQGELGKVLHIDLQGKRQFKFDFLLNNSLKSVSWNNLQNDNLSYFFSNKQFDTSGVYENGFKLNELFGENNAGLVTSRDSFIIQNSENEVKKTTQDFAYLDSEIARRKYNLGKDSRDWTVKNAQKDLIAHNLDTQNIKPILYRPFDIKYLYYTAKSKGFISYPRNEILRHLKNDNFALITTRLLSSTLFSHSFISNIFVDKCTISNRGKETNYVFPLYLYPKPINEIQEDDFQNKLARLEESKVIYESAKKAFIQVQKMFSAVSNPDKELLTYYNQQVKNLKKLELEVEKFKIQLANSQAKPLFESEIKRKPNLNLAIIKQIADALGIPTMLPNGEAPFGGLGALDILDYIYAVLHSPTYREKYKEFLKIDFPKIPYPKTYKVFEDLIGLGSQLRQIHLLESPTIEKYITQYPEDGNNVITKPRFSPSPSGRAGVGLVYINETQYFDNVPQIAWDFYIGGYQPAQKWLKDRKDKKLEFDDILHYQKIIVALTETDRLMKEIDNIEIE